jgi:chemotaxis protein CheD
MKKILLLPGELRISKVPEVIETLVGSCVAVCLYNTANGSAAMNHFLRSDPGINTDFDPGEFGSTSTEYIIKALMAKDPDPKHYRAQVFGGGAVIKSKSSAYNIGLHNIDVALKILAAHRIRVVNKDVGGERGRRVTFDTSTNTATCRYAGQVSKKYRAQTSLEQ